MYCIERVIQFVVTKKKAFLRKQLQYSNIQPINFQDKSALPIQRLWRVLLGPLLQGSRDQFFFEGTDGDGGFDSHSPFMDPE